MKIPHVRLSFNAAVAALTLLWFAMFAVSRVSIFIGAYNRSVVDRLGHAALRDTCLTHANVRSVAGKMCSEHAMLADVSPVLIAMQAVADNTHSCGTLSCVDLLGSILERSSSTLFYLVLGIASAALLYAVVSRIAAPNVTKALRPNDYAYHNIEQVPYYNTVHPTRRVAYAYGHRGRPLIETENDID